MKEKLKEIIKKGIQPGLKNAGFKKTGYHFRKSINDIQQVVTLQLSHGNSTNQLRFYFRCGVLIDKLKPDLKRELKNEAEGDYRFSIDNITNELQGDDINISPETDIESLSEKLDKIINADLIPFFEKLSDSESCIKFMIELKSLQSSFDLIKYFCVSNRIEDLKTYISNQLDFIESIKHKYNDSNTALKRIGKMKELIEKQEKYTGEIDLIFKSWGVSKK